MPLSTLTAGFIRRGLLDDLPDALVVATAAMLEADRIIGGGSRIEHLCYASVSSQCATVLRVVDHFSN